VKELGGPDGPGVGFALGMERLVMTIPPVAVDARCEVYLAALVPGARDYALRLQRELRKAGVSVLMDHEGRGLKSQMKRADKLGARYVAIMGEDELAQTRWTVRDMKASSQEAVGLDAAADYLIKETTVG
jgi:histidyl-tRNA synthetase